MSWHSRSFLRSHCNRSCSCWAWRSWGEHAMWLTRFLERKLGGDLRAFLVNNTELEFLQGLLHPVEGPSAWSSFLRGLWSVNRVKGLPEGRNRSGSWPMCAFLPFPSKMVSNSSQSMLSSSWHRWWHGAPIFQQSGWRWHLHPKVCSNLLSWHPWWGCMADFDEDNWLVVWNRDNWISWKAWWALVGKGPSFQGLSLLVRTT